MYAVYNLNVLDHVLDWCSEMQKPCNKHLIKCQVLVYMIYL